MFVHILFQVPFAITLSGSMLYITEWESQSIIKYDTLSETSSVFGVAYLAMGITYSRLKQDKTGQFLQLHTEYLLSKSNSVSFLLV